MIVLYFIACALTDINDCKELHIQFMEPDTTLSKCYINAQLEIIKWWELHPNYVISNFKCIQNETEFRKA